MGKRLKKLKKEKGITLIALVITIIVLLILAAVSIATLTGENGILTKANNAKTTNDKAQAEEEMKLVVADWQLEKKSNSSAELGDFLNEKLEKGELDGVTDNKDGSYTIERNGYEATISDEEGLGEIAEVVPPKPEPPKETIFKNVDTTETYPDGSMPEKSTVLVDDANEGIVIRDTNNNEWVWIEVPKSIYKNPDYTKEGVPSGETNYDKITKVLKAYADPYTKGSATQTKSWTDEWYLDTGTGSTHNIVTEETASPEQKELDAGCGLTLSQYKETYQKMLKSVYNNGGFWIGRYEAGIEGTTGTDLSNARTTHTYITDSSPKAISQKDAIPYNYLSCSEAQKLASKMTPDSNKTSSLLFGIQWDLVCKFIEEKEVKKQGNTQRETIKASINSNSEEWGNYNNVAIPINNSEKAKHSLMGTNKWEIKVGTKPVAGAQLPAMLSVGASTKTKKLNIYDFAGNEFEWTLEHATAYADGPCSNRGGNFSSYSYSYPASCRNDFNTSDAFGDHSFRPALY